MIEADGSLRSFQDISRDIARHFLQTVVVVDDQAAMAADDRADLQQSPVTLQTPGRRDASGGSNSDENQIRPLDAQHSLNAKELIDAFADRGLVCSVLRPIWEDERIVQRTTKLVQRADLVVLDWQIGQDSGKRTMEIIANIVAGPDGVRSHRLCLIAVYTGDPTVATIGEEIRKHLDSVGHPSSMEEDGFVVQSGACRVVVFSKEHSEIPSQYESRKVTTPQLPDALIGEFTEMTGGLVSNVAIQALSDIRDKTHVLLKTMSKDLDAPYLTHRALIEDPDESRDLLISIVTSEFRALFDESAASRPLGADAVIAWLAQEFGAEHSFLFGSIYVTLPEVKTWLTTGTCGRRSESDMKGLRAKYAVFTQQFRNGASAADAERYDIAFLKLTKLRTRYNTRRMPPLLTLGVVVQEVGDNGVYLLCIQPPCDSVRLQQAATFPFLPYRVKSKAPFDLVVDDPEGNSVRLELRIKPSQCQMIEFRPGEGSGAIHASRDTPSSNAFFFRDTSQRMFRWIAELKFEQAQKVVNEFASSIARVGLDDYEWLRRIQKK